LTDRIPLKKPITSEFWDKNQVAWFFGINEDTIRRWRELKENPIPCIGAGHSRKFNIFTVLEWHKKYEKQRWQTQKARGIPKETITNPELPELEESEKRLEHYRAELQAIKLKEAKKELIPTKLVQGGISAIISQTRIDLLSIPNRLRGAHGNAVYEDAKALIEGALKNMSAKLAALDIDSLIDLAQEPNEDASDV